jgi:hypothetical protein
MYIITVTLFNIQYAVQPTSSLCIITLKSYMDVQNKNYIHLSTLCYDILNLRNKTGQYCLNL